MAACEYPGNPAGMGIRFERLAGGGEAGGHGSWPAWPGAAEEGDAEAGSILTKSEAAFAIPSRTASTALSPRSVTIGLDDDEVCSLGKVRVRWFGWTRRSWMILRSRVRMSCSSFGISIKDQWITPSHRNDADDIEMGTTYPGALPDCREVWSF